MGKFKQYVNTDKPDLKKIKKLIGGAHIHTGFASIHKNDRSDKLLFVPKFLKEDEDKGDIEVEEPPHHTKMKSLRKERGPYPIDSDRIEFEHHHALNLKHLKKHYGASSGVIGSAQVDQRAPIEQYTSSSGGLNNYLITKHKAKGGDTSSKAWLLIHKHEYAGYHERNVTTHRGLAKETNHKNNALKNDTITHSGIGEHMGHVLNRTNVGDHVHFPAYTSTSTDYKIAHSFAFGHYKPDKDDAFASKREKHVAHFHLPKGYTKARHVENISKNSGEHELIIHHGQTFKKVAHHHEDDLGDLNNSTHHHHFEPITVS